MALCCIAIVGKKNNPVFLHTVAPDPDLKFHFLVHASLDVIEEKASGTRKEANDVRDPYLGALYPSDQYRVFGFLTNTQIKFIIVVDGTSLKEPEIRALFRQLHDAYLKLVCNPFYKAEAPLNSRRFDATIRGIVQSLQAAE